MIMQNAWELWNYLEVNSGMDFRDRDRDLKLALYEQLEIPSSTANLSLQLETQNISIERFINSFFKILSPYVEMMRDLCIFFEKNKVIATNEAIRMSFDFGEGCEDLGFDLKQFSESIRKYTHVWSMVNIYEFTTNNLWPLYSTFNPNFIRLDTNPITHPWLEVYNKGNFSSPDIEFPSTSDTELDKLITEIMSVWKAYVNLCISYGENIEECSKNLNSLPDREIYFIQSDHWAKSLLSALLWRIGVLNNMAPSDRRGEIKKMIDKAKDVLKNIPVKDQSQQIKREDLMDILKLPYWRKRHILYQSWLLAVIEKTLSAYNSQVLHIDGVLELKFKATKVIEAKFRDSVISLWAELKTPISNPTGKGRTNNIQPDYTLYIQSDSTENRCFSVVECKQYRRGNTRNFSQAINDYASGHLDAYVFLVNDGSIARSIDRQIKHEYKPRTRYWAGIRPGAAATSDFITTLTTLCNSQRSISTEPEKFDLIAIDISGSMINHLADDKIRQQIITVGQSSPNAILISINTTVVNRWSNSSKESIEQLLDLGISGYNHLPSALAGYNLQKAFIITDADGASQIRSANLQPAQMLVLI